MSKRRRHIDVSKFRVCLVGRGAYPEHRNNPDNPFASLCAEERLEELRRDLARCLVNSSVQDSSDE